MSSLDHTGPLPPVDGSIAPPSQWWGVDLADLEHVLQAGPLGLSSDEAAARLESAGRNELRPVEEVTRLRVLLSQFRSPLVIILIFAAVVSGIVAEWVDTIIIIGIVLGSGLLGFLQEYRASAAVAELRARVQLMVRVRRDGVVRPLPAAELVPGDVVVVSTGGLVPADGRIISASDCHVSEAILTGEMFPVEKAAGTVDPDTPLSQRTNALWMGTTIRAGTAEMLVVDTAGRTEYGRVAQRLGTRAPETAFERGIRRFGYLLTKVMVVLVLVVFAANVFLDKPRVDSLLFAIALAVGIAPELLPAIMAINLSHGARRMAAQGVIVRQLNGIENLGSMDVLCTDKTGTITEGAVTLDGGYGPDGAAAQDPVTLGAVNASLQAGLQTPIDQALLDAEPVAGWEKLDEIPFDFFRKRVSVIARSGDGPPLLICKGAFESVLAVCARTRRDPATPLDEQRRRELIDRFERWSRDGWRVVAVAVTGASIDQSYGPADEHDLEFVGYLRFADPPKADAAGAIADLRRLGVEVKIISGDVEEVTAHIARQVGLDADRVLTGRRLGAMSDEALVVAARETDLFVEVDPTHKERIVVALRRGGRVVGFLGDGVNDAPALHAADVGISVETAVDVAREAAGFVLLRPELGVLRDGVVEGRRTFANTMKYITTTESANFGNMLSMAAASFFLPFLPLTATQVLLNNFLSDFPATTIATDSVDPELVEAPERWDLGAIRRFMITFGAVSSLFDLATFAVLLWVFGASVTTFRTGWFVESLLTELVIALVVRTRRPFYRSRPGSLLLWSSLAVIALTTILPYLPFAGVFGFEALSLVQMAALVAITCLYVIATEATKRWLGWRTRRSPA
jgi:Mg2+-importing ATPase